MPRGLLLERVVHVARLGAVGLAHAVEHGPADAHEPGRGAVDLGEAVVEGQGPVARGRVAARDRRALRVARHGVQGDVVVERRRGERGGVDRCLCRVSTGQARGHVAPPHALLGVDPAGDVLVGVKRSEERGRREADVGVDEEQMRVLGVREEVRDARVPRARHQALVGQRVEREADVAPAEQRRRHEVEHAEQVGRRHDAAVAGRRDQHVLDAHLVYKMESLKKRHISPPHRL